MFWQVPIMRRLAYSVCSNGMKNRTLVITAVGMAAVAALIFFGDRAAFKQASAITIRVLRPFLETAAELGRWPYDRPDTSRGTSKEKVYEFRIAALNRENEELRRLLGFKETRGFDLLGSRVILFSREGGREFFLIDQGVEAGVKAGDLVLDSWGVMLGVVKESGNGFAKVEVASNAGLIFETQILPLGARALARGLGGRAFAIELVPQDTPLRVGDFAAILGAGEGEMILGEIVRIKTGVTSAFQEARAVMLGRPERLSRVFIKIK